jgi:hypothetical protein
MVVTGTAPVANGTRVAFKTTDTLPAIGSALGTATTCTISGNLMTLSGTGASIVIQPGQTVVGTGITPGTTITAYGTLTTGYDGTYYVSKNNTVGPISINTYATLSTSVLYYTQNASGNTYKISTDGVTAINGVSGTSAAGTGTHTAITSPLKFVPHSCPSVTVTGSTGHPYIEDTRNAPQQGRPLFSYGSRTMSGQMPASAPALSTPIRVQGTLKQMIINVLKTDTSSGGASTMTITATGFDSNLASSNFSATIDLKTTGIRTITNVAGTTSTPVGTDSFSHYTGTISGDVNVATSVALGSQPSGKYAQVFLSVETDQGVFTVPSVGYYNDTQWPNTVTQIDTTSPGIGTHTGI